MLNKTLRILNFDDSVVKQRGLIRKYQTDTVDLKDIGARARFWMDKKSETDIRGRIRHSAKNSVTFLGSGDFHQVSSILIDELEDPVCVIHFDFHPDWSIFPLRTSCGGWVTKTLGNRNVLKYIIVGICSDVPSGFSIQTGNFASLRDDRVEVYPYEHVPSVLFLRRVPENKSVTVRRGLFFGKVYWNELKKKKLKDFFLKIIEKLPTRRVYVSIDKDCLKKEYSMTNWHEGRLSLEELLMMLRIVKENLDIVGMDITGDYSRVHAEGVFKSAVSRINHPKFFSARGFSDSRITAINESTNLKIIGLLND